MNASQLALFDPSEEIRPPLEQSLVKAASTFAVEITNHTAIHPQTIRAIMNKEFIGSDTNGIWTWKDAYDALEAAQVLVMRQLRGSLPPFAALGKLTEIGNLCPTHKRRSEEAIAYQQFSTPLPLAYLVAAAAQISPDDVLLEPSAGTGMLAQFGALEGAKALLLNELNARRASILKALFPLATITNYNAEQINDYHCALPRPSVILMNPPFSASPNIAKRNKFACRSHIRSALLRLVDRGRLVAVGPHWFNAENPDWQAFFKEIEEYASVLLSVGIEGKAYAKHGTTMESRILVIDKYPGFEQGETYGIGNLETALSLILKLPPRLEVNTEVPEQNTTKLKTSYHNRRGGTETPRNGESKNGFADLIPVAYTEKRFAPPSTTDGLYCIYEPRRIEIEGAKPHPSLLCESTALGLVCPPVPQYQPLLPRAVVNDGLLSAAQLETVIYAGEAHSKMLRAYYKVNERFEIELARSGDPNGVQFRQGFFLADGTGCGKGRQIAGIVLDNWAQGRKKAIWISKSDTLIEDARRDWKALGNCPDEIFSLGKISQGSEIKVKEGILFTTYATLRSAARQGKQSRLEQIINWCGKDFDGVIAFDECHAMGNAVAEKAKIGTKQPSLQGIVGLQLQNALPGSRIVYVSATGASKVSSLAYTSRLGLWQTQNFPFANRSDFIQNIESGGIAAMEVVARDLKALGLYVARNLSFAGVEYDALNVELTQQQVEIYNAYAETFKIIHANLNEALIAANITSADGKILNKQAKACAISVFESHKQRFFNHLIASMKCLELIRAIEEDIENGYACVIQLVSTNESLLEKRLAKIPREEWNDINIDITPREYVLEYLESAFPIQLYKEVVDEEGKRTSVPVYHEDGSPVINQEALIKRDRTIESLSSLPPIPGALDQIVQHFGHEQIAEVTGRKRRILREENGSRLYVSDRPHNANLCETEAFMSGNKKKILVFSDAGGTGRSYHADMNCGNQSRRIQYLLEPGWRAENAIQGLGRTHRTHQKSAPIFRPVISNVPGEKRFISAIARRLDALGALTKGQRQSGGQGLFDASDNLESNYANTALKRLFLDIYAKKVTDWPLSKFEQATGLALATDIGFTSQPPGLSTFLNRLLALPIHEQESLFEAFELRLEAEIEAAISSGTYDLGIEVLKAEKFVVKERSVVYKHQDSGSETICHTIEQTDKAKVVSFFEALDLITRYKSSFQYNEMSKRVVASIPATSTLDEDGGIVKRVEFIRPNGDREKVALNKLAKTCWKPIPVEIAKSYWETEYQEAPKSKISTLYLLTGLLLPIWKCLSLEDTKVYRLTTEDGEQLLGRVVASHQIRAVRKALGLEGETSFSANDIFDIVWQQGQSFSITDNVSLRRSKISGEYRLELVGIYEKARIEQFKNLGCFTEIIDWKTRIFVAVNNAQNILEKIKHFYSN